MLGYDYTPDEVKRVLEGAPDDLAAERRLLELYADVRTLTRPHADGLDDEDDLGSPQEHLHAFLRSLDAESEGLPDRYVVHLSARARALRRRGARAHRRARGRRLPAVPLPAARGHRARGACAPCSPATSSAATRSRARPATPFRAVLDRLETALAPREPALAELAREVRWRCCDAPGLAAGREATYAEMAEHLDALAEGGGDREATWPRWSSARSRWRPLLAPAAPATPAR